MKACLSGGWYLHPYICRHNAWCQNALIMLFIDEVALGRCFVWCCSTVWHIQYASPHVRLFCILFDIGLIGKHLHLSIAPSFFQGCIFARGHCSSRIVSQPGLRKNPQGKWGGFALSDRNTAFLPSPRPQSLLSSLTDIISSSGWKADALSLTASQGG